MLAGMRWVLAATAAAHGFGQRFDLPLPLWLWVTGAGATIVLTFAVMAVFVRERRFPATTRAQFAAVRPGALDRLPAIVGLIRLVAAMLFLLTLCAGFFGVQDPYANLITTMVWVMWWVGFAFVCALVGDLWALVNPLRTIFAWGEKLYARRHRRPASRRCPIRLAGRLACGGAVSCFRLGGAGLAATTTSRATSRARCSAMPLSPGSACSSSAARRGSRTARRSRSRSACWRASRRSRPQPRELSCGRPARAFAERAGAVSFLVFVLLMLATRHLRRLPRDAAEAADDDRDAPSRRYLRCCSSCREWGFDETQLIATAALRRVLRSASWRPIG